MRSHMHVGKYKNNCPNFCVEYHVLCVLLASFDIYGYIAEWLFQMFFSWETKRTEKNMPTAFWGVARFNYRIKIENLLFNPTIVSSVYEHISNPVFVFNQSSFRKVKCENKVVLECIEHNSHFGHDFSSQCENIK